MARTKAPGSIAVVLGTMVLLSACTAPSPRRVLEEKTALRRQIEGSMTDLDTQIVRLRDALDTAGWDSKAGLRLRIEQMEDARSDLFDKEVGLDYTSRDHWNEFRNEVATSLARARDILKQSGPERGLSRV